MLYQDHVAHWWGAVLSTSAYWMLNQITEASHFYQVVEHSCPFFQNEEKSAVSSAIRGTFKAVKSIHENGLDKDYFQIFDKASNNLDIAAKYMKYSADEEIHLTDEELIMKVRANLYFKKSYYINLM